MISLNGALSLNVLFTIIFFIMMEIYFNITSDRTANMYSLQKSKLCHLYPQQRTVRALVAPDIPSRLN